jgi:hypothetical protein
VSFDQSSYAPGDRIYVKVLVTYPNGSIVGDANVGGEIFQMSQEEAPSTLTGSAAEVLARITAAASTVGGESTICRMYLYFEGPIYYKAGWIQKYYIDDSYIPSNCLTGKYVLRLTVSRQGYTETKIEKEFDVALSKLFMETGFCSKRCSRDSCPHQRIQQQILQNKFSKFYFLNHAPSFFCVFPLRTS